MGPGKGGRKKRPQTRKKGGAEESGHHRWGHGDAGRRKGSRSLIQGKPRRWQEPQMAAVLWDPGLCVRLAD